MCKTIRRSQYYYAPTTILLHISSTNAIGSNMKTFLKREKDVATILRQYCSCVPLDRRPHIWRVYGQNGDTETATEMAIVKTLTNPNNTYSSSDAYIIDRRLYTYNGMQLLSYMKKYNIPLRAMPDVSAKQIWARDILLMTELQKLHTWIHWNLVKSSLKRSIVDESKFIRLLWTCSRFGLSPFWPYPVQNKRKSVLNQLTWTTGALCSNVV